MRLCIVRHGKAEPAVLARSDAERGLVEKGREQAEWLGAELAGRSAPEALLSSPIRRALQTAEVLARALGITVECDARLRTGQGVSDALALIAERPAAPVLLIVGHNPQLEELVGHLVDGRSAGPLRTGEAAVIEFDAAHPAPRSARLLERLRLEPE